MYQLKIGIITFHWATNYGAVLQCYALQETLRYLGHDAVIINYKPSKYDNNLWTFFRMKKFIDIRKFISDIRKEMGINAFRKQYLNLTKRYRTTKQLQKYCNDFDVIISGSDQVLNDTFLRGGERHGSTAYYLDFGRQDAIRVCYAVSFGQTAYPIDLIPKVKPLVKKLNAVSCRENTGVEIFKSFGISTACVVPDPTLLLSRCNYERLLPPNQNGLKNTFVYLLHGRYNILKNKLPDNVLISSSEDIQEWLQNIRDAKFVITNSFHGTVFCIHFHVPFVVVLPTLDNVGMNDRFYTLLSNLRLSDRMILESDFKYTETFNIDWVTVDRKLKEYTTLGLHFLNKAFN